MSASARAEITVWAVTLSACAVAVGACTDSTEPDSSPLALPEATALFVGLRAATSDTTFTPIFFSADSIVVRCPLAGRAKLVGSIEDRPPVNDTARLVTDFDITPTGCGFTSLGFEFTVDGNPSIRDITTTSIVTTTLQFLLDGSTSGALDWELAGRTGTCEIDLTLTGRPDFSGTEPSFSARYTGMMCGYEVDFDASELISPPG